MVRVKAPEIRMTSNQFSFVLPSKWPIILVLIVVEPTLLKAIYARGKKIYIKAVLCVKNRLYFFLPLFPAQKEKRNQIFHPSKTSMEHLTCDFDKQKWTRGWLNLVTALNSCAIIGPFVSSRTGLDRPLNAKWKNRSSRTRLVRSGTVTADRHLLPSPNQLPHPALAPLPPNPSGIVDGPEWLCEILLTFLRYLRSSRLHLWNVLT